MRTDRCTPVLLMLATTLLVSPLMLSCDDHYAVVPPVVPENSWPTPRENVEAELAALWLSGELLAPDTLYTAIEQELTLIRARWSDSIPETSIPFRPYWEPGSLLLNFAGAELNQIETGHYPYWDTLNEQCHLSSFTRLANSSLLLLVFDGNVNPNALVEKYAGLPGLQYAVPAVYPGDRPRLLIDNTTTPRKYFFRNAWTNCVDGCDTLSIHYFTVIADSALCLDAALVTPSLPSDSLPLWWPDYATTWERFNTLTMWPPQAVSPRKLHDLMLQIDAHRARPF